MIGLSALLLSAALAMPPGAPIDLGPAQERAAEETARLSPEERLDERLAALREADSEAEAEAIAEQVTSLWRQQGGDTADLLLLRAREAIEKRDIETAESQYAWLRELEPEFSEAWLLSAELAMADGDWDFAFDALTEAVSLEPRRFDAYVLLGRTLERAESPAAALEAYHEALRIHPWHPQARSARRRLEQELSGRAL